MIKSKHRRRCIPGRTGFRVEIAVAMLCRVNAETISVGTELTCGITVDTNAAWLAARLTDAGFHVLRHTIVPDRETDIGDAVRAAAVRSAVVIVTGGLGPTADDRTRQGLALAAGRPLMQDDAALAQIRSFFERIQRPMTDSNRLQALVPEGAAVIENSCGTAPGIRMEIGNCTVHVLPGVPREMRIMFDRSVAPLFPPIAHRRCIATRTLNCFGATEAHIGEQIADLMAAGREPLVNITAQDAVIRVRIVAGGTDTDAATRAAEADAREVHRRLGPVVFGEGDTTPQEAVAKFLVSRNMTISVAESCTGGLLAKRLTDVPGSSAYFVGGVVAYADRVKTAKLGVLAETIDREGAVSEAVAKELAAGCRSLFLSDIAVSATGIAGPGGGTGEKPVGLVYVAFASADEVDVRRLLLGGHLGRDEIRDRATKAALNMIRTKLMRVGT